MATVEALRRYPVKSMGGEALREVELDERGLVGDRGYAVRDTDDRLASGKDSRRFRRRDAVFDYAARGSTDGVVVSGAGDRWLAGDPALDTHLSAVMGAQVRLASESDVPHQDDGQVSLVGTATLAWCAERWGIEADPRRLRANVVVATDEPFVEEEWVEGRLRLGTVVLAVLARTPRCRMVDLAQDGASGRGRWLAPLGRERDTCVGVYADVVTAGRIRVGDPVRPS